MADTIDCLNLNMEHRCTWSIDINNQLVHNRTEGMNLNNQLYAFIVYNELNEFGEVKYVGKTTKTLVQRFKGYTNPGNGQATNWKVHCMVRLALESGHRVESYSFQDNTPLQWNGVNLNIAAGIEDGVIAYWRPEWNLIRNKDIPCSKVQKEFANVDDHSEDFVKPIEHFNWNLGKTYFEKGFMNPGVKVEHLLGEDGEQVKLTLPNNEVVTSLINRRANSNHTVRLYFPEVVPYLQENHRLNDSLLIEIVDAQTLRILSDD